MKLFLVLLASLALVSAEDLIYRNDPICHERNVACGTELEPIYRADHILDKATEEKLNILFSHYDLTYGEVSNVSFADAPGARNAINDKLIALIEYARTQFSVGFPGSGVPPIDPFYHENYSPDPIKKWYLHFTANFDKIYARGVKNFVIHKLDFQMVGLTLTFDISLAELRAISQYRLNIKVIGVPYNPRGDASVTLSKLRVTGVVNLGIMDNHLNIKAFKLGFDLGKVKLYLSGLLGDGLINTFFNWILSKISKSEIEKNHEKIAKFLSNNIKDLANVYLKNVNLIDLIG